MAHGLLEAFAGAVWFIPLADLADARLIAGAVIDAMRMPRSPGREPLEQAIETLRVEEPLTPEHLIVRREELERLYAAIRKLPLLQQQVLRLRVGDGLRFSEIAVLLNKREEAVRKVFSRTLALLRAIYDQQ